MYEYHLHSHFSGDCQEQMEDIILEAIKKGGKQICFTDHLDYDYPTTEIQFEFDPEAFLEKYNEMYEKYKGLIHLQKGIEMGLQPHIIDQCLAFNKRFQPEFVICSFHVAQKKDLFNGDFFVGKTGQEAWDVFLDDMYETLSKFKDYSVVGHLDILKRYNDSVKEVPFAYYKDKYKRILDLIIADERGIEVNISGWRTDLNETLPARHLLEMYHELGGQYITIGSDAHKKDDIYSHFKPGLELLADIGFEYFTIYENRQPIQVSIKKTLESL